MKATGNFKLSGITRIEVIDENGRSYVNKDKNNVVELSFQDRGDTLKIYIKKKQEDETSTSYKDRL